MKEIPELNTFIIDDDVLYELLETDDNLGIQVITSVS